jgi:hypothetical protein
MWDIMAQPQLLPILTNSSDTLPLLFLTCRAATRAEKVVKKGTRDDFR